jgi:hypothetical protein
MFMLLVAGTMPTKDVDRLGVEHDAAQLVGLGVLLSKCPLVVLVPDGDERLIEFDRGRAFAGRICAGQSLCPRQDSNLRHTV